MDQTKIKENVFGDILRFKTKAFPVPFNVQYLGKTDDSKLAILSDGKKSAFAKFSSKYNYFFEENIVSPYAILTVYEVQRVAAGSKTIFIDNISVDRSLQIGVKIGNPSPI